MKGDGRVFQRGEIWWVAYYHDSRSTGSPRSRECAGTPSGYFGSVWGRSLREYSRVGRISTRRNTPGENGRSV